MRAVGWAALKESIRWVTGALLLFVLLPLGVVVVVLALAWRGLWEEEEEAEDPGREALRELARWRRG